jgi:NTP pyrophosphatase (non-canonical NTP hydrolase)
MTTTPMTTVNEIADAVHALAWRQGWHSDEENLDAFLERACNNLHDEVSELHEAWRNNDLHNACDKSEKMIALGLSPLTCIEEELADIVIRVFDNARKFNVDILSAILRKHSFNASRPLRHGGKKS